MRPLLSFCQSVASAFPHPSLPPHLLPHSPSIICTSFHSPFHDFSDPWSTYSAFEFVSDKGLGVPVVTKIAPHWMRGKPRRGNRPDSGLRLVSWDSWSNVTDVSHLSLSLFCFAQAAALCLSGSACTTRTISAIWTNIRQIRSVLVIVTIVQRDRYTALWPEERQANASPNWIRELELWGHLVVITVQRFFWIGFHAML